MRDVLVVAAGAVDVALAAEYVASVLPTAAPAAAKLPSLLTLVGLPDASDAAEGRVVVMAVDGRRIPLRVEGILSMRSIPPGDLLAVPAAVQRGAAVPIEAIVWGEGGRPLFLVSARELIARAAAFGEAA